MYLNTSKTVRPRWTVEPTDKQFAQGSDAKVDCKADGFPQPTISWKKAVGKSLNYLLMMNYILHVHSFGGIANKSLSIYFIPITF